MFPPFEDGKEFKPLSTHHVGALYELNVKTREARVRNIFADQELVIGRNPNKCDLVMDDPLVSNKHLRIYTVIFDQVDPEVDPKVAPEVAPLVYAQDLSLNGVCWNGYRMGKGNKGYLLNDGDVLQVTRGISLQFRCDRGTENHFCDTQAEEMEYIEKQYAITHRKLGSGTYGHVYMAIDRKRKIQLACKIVDLTSLKRKLWEQESSKAGSHGDPNQFDCNEESRIQHRIESRLKTYDREVEILQKLRHPNIIGIEKVFKTDNTLYIFQDLITAGDLFSFLEFKRGKLLDIEAAVIVRQIVIALNYLHDQNIVHRDLKPDNVLMTSLSAGCRVILTDFGCSREIKPQKSRMASIMGTLEYTAPEINHGKSTIGYTKSVDLWSLGCLTAVLLTGGSPFSDPKTGKYSEILAKQCDLQLLEADEIWKCVGKRAKDFVRKLLVLREDKRLTAKEAYAHHWFTNPTHRHAFEGVYRRAIKGWRPNPPSRHVLYDLRRNRQMEENNLWRRMPERSENVSHIPRCRNISITLSDPGLRKESCAGSFERMNNNDETSDNTTLFNPRVEDCPSAETGPPGIGSRKGQEPHNTERGLRLPFSPEAWSKGPGSPRKKTNSPLLSKNNNIKEKNEISLEGLMLPPSLYPLPNPPPYPALSKDKRLKQKQVSFHAPRRPKRPVKDVL